MSRLNQRSLNCAKAAAVLACLLLASSCASSSKTEALADTSALPNIVFIMADDLGYGDIRSFNPEGKIPTPHIDSLARDGMRFTDAHSSSAICTPSRYGVLTGRYSWRTKLQAGNLNGWSRPLIKKNRTTVASMLKSRGYRTGAFGKWHLGWNWPTTDDKEPIMSGRDEGANIDYARPITHGPLDRGFDSYFGIPASLDMLPFVYVRNNRVEAAPTEQIPVGKGQGFHRSGMIAPGFRHEDVLPRCTKEAVRFIEEAKSGEPFFLYVPMSAPHAPIVPTAPYAGATGKGVYADFVSQVDGSVGELLKALERKGLTENTLVIFTADNGCSPMADFKHLESIGHRHATIFRGCKGDIFEGGHRVPFVARWPEKVAAGTESKATICLTDLMATAAEITGAELGDQDGADSTSFLPQLAGRGDARDAAVVNHASNGTFAIREGFWKLILGPGSGGTSRPKPEEAIMKGMPMMQLYDLRNDPSEITNLSADRPEVVERLTQRLKEVIARDSNVVSPVLNKAARLKASDYKLVEVDHLAKGAAVSGAGKVGYAEKGARALTDGWQGTSWFGDGYWAGFEGRDMDVVIDLGRVRTVKDVTLRFLSDQGVWAFYPERVQVSGSTDRRNWGIPVLADFHLPKKIDGRRTDVVTLPFKGRRVRYLHVKATSIKTCPDWHKGRGGKCWLFADEIVVR